jgi:hypothetical protein
MMGLISVLLGATRIGMFALLGFAIAGGLWKGWRGPRLLAIFSSALILIFGVPMLFGLTQGGPMGPVQANYVYMAIVGLIPASCAAILLLVLPRSSRSWFARYRRPKS